jgi:hypothetical protein
MTVGGMDGGGGGDMSECGGGDGDERERDRDGPVVTGKKKRKTVRPS